MRAIGLSVLVLAVAVVSLPAQDPKAQPPKDPPTAATKLSEKNQQLLDAVLDRWEKRMAKIDAIETKIILTEIEAGPPAVKTQFSGDASLLKPNCAKLFLKEATDPTNSRKWRHFVADGNVKKDGKGPHLWEYDYAKKIVRVMEMPRDGVGDNTMLKFLFGLTAADIKKRYDLAVDVDDKEKYNDFYVHITILPKLREDQQEFKKAELVLWKNNTEKYADLWMLPARLWFQHPNGNQVVWEFKNMTTQKKLLKRDFEAPGFPGEGWKSEWMKPPTAPTVSRTSGPKK